MNARFAEPPKPKHVRLQEKWEKQQQEAAAMLQAVALRDQREKELQAQLTRENSPNGLPEPSLGSQEPADESMVSVAKPLDTFEKMILQQQAVKRS